MRPPRATLSEAWVWVTLLMLGLGYVFSVPGLLALGGLLATVFGLAWLWNHWSLRGVRYERRIQYRRAFPGESVECEIDVTNAKPLPLTWLKTTDRWPKDVGPDDPGLLAASHRPEEGIYTQVLAMRGFARVRRSFELRFRSRGVYTIGPAEVEAGDPFDLFFSKRSALGEERLTVFPQVTRLADFGLMPDDPFGEHASRRRLFEDTSRPMGVRDYQPEDEFRRIHWPATAKLGRLQTRTYQPVRGLDLVVCLNASTFGHHWEGTNPEKLESLISLSASLVMESFDQGFRVGLLSNGSIAHSGQAFRIPPGRSPQHLPLLLEALAGLTPLVTAPFERYLLAQAPRLEYGSILVVVTAVTPAVLMEALARLKARNRRTSLISIADEAPPYLEGVETFHIPDPARIKMSEAGT